MPKNEADRLNRKAMGTFALAALISAILARFFSVLALADTRPILPPPLDLGAQNIGLYQVSSVESDGGDETSLRWLHSKIWVIRFDKQLALLNVNETSETPISSAILPGPSGTFSCLAALPSGSNKTSLFQSNLCRGFFNESNEENDFFRLSEKMDVTNGAIVIATGGLAGGNISFSISVPKGEQKPKEIRVRRSEPVAFMIPDNDIFILSRIQD
ncbi:hypothetical protein WDW37_05045 [Bdellovibrionota bacterium FG-1]